MKPESERDGTRTRDGHAETQSWHAVHLSAIFAIPPEPGGDILNARSGLRLARMGARPPSTFIVSAASAAAPPASIKSAEKNLLRPFLINTIRFVIMVLLDSEKFQRVLFCRKFRRGLVLNRL